MPIPLRAEFDAAGLRAAARDSKDAGQTRRLLALAAICDGATRTEAAPRSLLRKLAGIGGVTLPAANASRFGEIVRDWVMKLNAHGPAGLIDRKAPGQPRRLDGTHRAALVAAVESGPVPAVHGVVRWRVVDLRQWLHDEFEVSVSEQTLSRELRELGYHRLSARPRHHSQAEGAIEVFKEAFPRAWTKTRAQGVDPDDMEVWFGDEARIGQKNKIARRWAKKGSRPPAPHDQRRASVYLFGAVCPQDGKAAGLILPWCNIEAMELHLAAIFAKVAPGRHL